MATRSDTAHNSPMKDMNTTPLIDVMLVLLIIFIISLPRTTHAVKVELPPAGAADTRVRPVVNRLAIAANGTLIWNGATVDMLTLRHVLGQATKMVPEPELQFRPDPAVRYDRVDQTMATIKRAGVTKLGFVGNENYSGAL